MLRLRFAFLLLFTSMITTSVAAPGDENWATTWSLGGADGEVTNVLTFDGDLVVTGFFSNIGDVPAAGVARYDGTTWSAFGDGVHGEVYGAAVYDGDLLVAGQLTDAWGTPIGGMARWNGASWDVDPFGATEYLDGIAALGNQLVIMGTPGTVGGVEVVGFAMWDGTQWNDMGITDFDVYGYDITSDATNVYVTGSIEFLAGEYVKHVARWDGSQWHAMGSGLTDEFGDPFDASGESIHAWDGKVAVSGYFAEAGGQALPNFAVWDGSSWGALGSDPGFFSGDTPYVIGHDGGDLYVFNGFSFLYRWNGLFWDGLGSGGLFNAAAPFAGDVFVGGSFRDFDGTVAQNLVRFDGTSTWSAVASGNGITRTADAVHVWDDLLVVTGNRSTGYGDDVQGALVAAWNGTDWVDLGLGTQGSAVAEIDHMVTYQGDLVVNGNIDNAGGTPCNSFARYDGTTWSPLGDANLNSGGLGMVVVDGTLYALTYKPGSIVARYDDGTDAWIEIGDNPGGTVFYGLGSYQGDVVATGSWSSIDGVAAERIAAWDGTDWAPLGAGVDGLVRTMVEHDGDLYVGGSFANAGGAPARNVAAWDGSTWSALGDGLGNQIRDLFVYDGAVHATGDFTSSGTEAVAHVARWDGSAWQPLGSGLNDDGQAMAQFEESLVVVGDFTTAGGISSANIAVWTATTSTSIDDGFVDETASLLRIGGSWPNPSTGRTTVSFDLERAASVRMEVLDVRGRRVSGRLLRGLGAGSHTVQWNGRDRAGRDVASGTYFVRLRIPGGTATTKVAVRR